jgi:predicted nicotinamide N-methyase
MLHSERLLCNLQRQLERLQAERTELQQRARDCDNSDSDEDADIELEGWSSYQMVEYKIDGKTIKLNCTPELTPYDALLLASYEDEEDTDLTGNRVWLGGTILMNYIAANRHDLVDKRVIELGSGCGLCGILAASGMASLSVVTDGDAGCVDLIADNITQNEEIITCKCLALAHQWGRVAAQKLMEDNGFEKFDVVMASDVLYAVEVLLPLMESAVELLVPSGVFILSNVPRCDHATINEAICAAATAAGLVKQESIGLDVFLQDPIALEEALECGSALFTLARA